ncbi:MAG TPA: DUF2332 domain-containing protein [Caulobacteraceae bacterium]
MNPDFTGLLQAFAFQKGACDHMGSPFSGRVLAILSEDIAARGVFAELAEAWDGVTFTAALNDAAPLRFLGGLHYLALSGAAPELTALYPAQTAEPAGDQLAGCVRRVGQAHREALARFALSPPQTNEVRRSICLVGGFLTLAQLTGLPLRCLEIGASAGLNQNWDRYRYRFSEAEWGDGESDVIIDTAWSGSPPPLVAAVVAERGGCDLRPIDTGDVDQALRLQAYVWPDQGDRLARLRAAIALARRYPPNLVAADAAEWVEATARPQIGVATVLFHSVVWQYLPKATRERIRAAIERGGEAARTDSPFAWLRMEPDPANPAGAMEIRLSLWPEKREILLARVHPHGAQVSWLSENAVNTVI